MEQDWEQYSVFNTTKIRPHKGVREMPSLNMDMFSFVVDDTITVKMSNDNSDQIEVRENINGEEEPMRETHKPMPTGLLLN